MTALRPIVWLVVAVCIAGGVILAAYRNRPIVRTYLGLPLQPATPEDEVLEDFDRHVEEALAVADYARPPQVHFDCPNCGGEVFVDGGAPAVFAHLRGHHESDAHRADFDQWEREVQAS